MLSRRRELIRQLFIIFSTLLVILVPLHTSALSDAQQKAITSGVYYFNTEEAAACSGTTAGTLTGSDTTQKIFNYFTSHGLGAIQAAGIMGNMSKESGFNPSAQQAPGSWEDMTTEYFHAVGLVQWDGGRRPAVINYAKSKGLTTADLESTSDKNLMTQLDYIMVELNGPYKVSTLVPMQAATTPDGAALIFHQHYEGSADSAAKIQGRLNDAISFYKLYGGTAVTSGSTAPSAASSCTGGGNFATSFVEYKQCNYNGKTVPWANAPYGNDTICDAGCGPSAMAMIVTNLTGQAVTPDMTAAYGAANGTTIDGGIHGSSWNIAQVIGSHWGLTATSDLGQNIIAINQVLQAGGLVLATGEGTDPFTSGGHFIVIRAITSDGKWLTGNSAGFDSSKPYDPQAVIAAGSSGPGFHTWGLTK